MKNRTEENRRNLEMIAPTWTLLGLALTACGGGGGGLSVSGPPPINANPGSRVAAPVREHSRVPDIREAPNGSPAIILTEGQNTIRTLYYRYEEHTFDSGGVSQENDVEFRIPEFTVRADGTGDVSQSVIEIDGLVQTYTSPRMAYLGGGGTYTYTLRVIINDYILDVDDFTVQDLVDGDIDSNSELRADAVSLSSVWSVTFSDYDANGRFIDTSYSGSTTIPGVLGVDEDGMPDGSIDITVSFYEDRNGDFYFEDASGRTLLGSETITFNDGTTDDDTPDVTFLGIREGSDYDVPVILTKVAKDGFGNIEIVARDGRIDSLPEVLEIEARGTTGDVYATGHIWYLGGEVITGATGSVLIAIEVGRYHAEVGVDLDGDRIADILVETLPVDIV